MVNFNLIHLNMKKIFLAIALLSICFFISSFTSKDVGMQLNTCRIQEDSIIREIQEKMQHYVNSCIKNGVLNIEKEEQPIRLMLDTKEKAKSFATYIILQTFPSANNIPATISISEDKSGKIWFVCYKLPSGHDSIVSMIFLKSNCKVLYCDRYM